MTDEERFARVYAEHRGDLERFVRRRLPPPQVEDAVAETFLVVWRRLDDLPSEARPWLFGIARRVMLTMTRGHGRWQALGVRLAREPEPAPTEIAAEVAGLTDLARAWARLTDGEREVIALTAWDGLTSREAAAVLGCRQGTYSVRLLRARRHLLDLLDRLPAEKSPAARPTVLAERTEAR
ncbi:RNA polymerase sigma factor [Georgenia subflava]|uniref:RNA polymerase sigma factor n=1 Tax=Georgenia subflava TaxID=1622177 RepID=UPI00186AC92E|nr:RNA polymerase sigma factor [Georgenia subflava]